MRKIIFNLFKDIDLVGLNDKNFYKYFEDFKTLAKSGFFGFQGQREVAKFDDDTLLSYFIYVFLNTNFYKREENNLLYMCTPSVVDKYVQEIYFKKELRLFDEDILKFYKKVAKKEKIEKLNIKEKR